MSIGRDPSTYSLILSRLAVFPMNLANNPEINLNGIPLAVSNGFDLIWRSRDKICWPSKYWRHLTFERSRLLSRAWSLSGKVRDGRSGLQALRERVVRPERHGARPPALPLRGVRPQLHADAGARQAVGDEGAGGAALCARQCQPGDDRQASGRQSRRRLQMGPRAE